MGVINGSWHIHIYKVLPLNSTQLTMTTEKKQMVTQKPSAWKMTSIMAIAIIQ